MNCIQEAWREINSAPLKEWSEKKDFIESALLFSICPFLKVLPKQGEKTLNL